MGFETCGPNEVIVVSGCCHTEPLLVPGGRVFVWPGIQKIQRLSLNTVTLAIDTPHVYTKLGVSISVTGIAQIKVDSERPDSLAKACEQFLGKSDQEVRSIAKETLEGHQRAMMGNMLVEDIYKDRKQFSAAVFEVATLDLVNMGLKVVSYTLKDIRDDEGYLKALGQARTAEVQRDARIGEAEAKRDAGIREALAEEQRMQARYANDIEIAQSKRDYELKQAAYDMEVQTKKAEADLAYSLQAAKTKQRIKEEQMEVKIVERSLQIQVQEQEIVRRDRELEATIKKPAEAEVYRLTKIAEANKNKVVLEAQAESESVRVKGEAEAYAIEAKARAEAEQMAKKADAWKEYQDAAIVDMLLESMPQIAAEVAAPLAQCKKVTLVTSGKGDVGAAKLTGEVFEIMERLPKMVEGMTGVDLNKMVKGAQSGRR